jgi:tripartite-type tricarboxylate transporter receptor subunit TctC
MKIKKSALFVALALGAAAPTINAADFPSRSIRVVVPSTPGGALDVVMRLMAPRLTAIWNQQIVIDNRAGAAGLIGTDIVAKSNPDGYTMLVVATGFAANPFMYKSLPYETPKDFTPITIMCNAPNVLALHPSTPFRSVKELIAAAKAKPGSINYGSSGMGTGGHLSMALLVKQAGIDLIHVPYKGAGAATSAVVAGQTQMLFTATSAVMPFVQSGRMRALAVTSSKRSAVLPDVPTVAESGLPGYEVDGWYAMLAPGRTPKPVVDVLYKGMLTALRHPETKAQIEATGCDVDGMPPEKFAKYIDAELKKWGAVIREAGIKAE